VITLELCQRHLGIGKATVIETWQVATREEADAEIAKVRPNDFFVREQDRSINDWLAPEERR
jgi:hypothetical protein